MRHHVFLRELDRVGQLKSPKVSFPQHDGRQGKLERGVHGETFVEPLADELTGPRVEDAHTQSAACARLERETPQLPLVPAADTIG